MKWQKECCKVITNQNFKIGKKNSTVNFKMVMFTNIQKINVTTFKKHAKNQEI